MDQLFERYRLLWLALLALFLCATVASILVGVNWILIFLKGL